MQMAESFLQGRNQEVGANILSCPHSPVLVIATCLLLLRLTFQVSLTRMHSPVFAGERLYYPFLPDFHAAVLKRTGGELRDGFLAPGFLLACSLWPLLYHLTVRVTRSRLAAVLGIALTVCAGGMGAFSVLKGTGSFAKALEVDTAQNDAGGGYTIFWFAFLPHVLLPQRGATFAYPLVLVCLLLLWRATDMTRPVPAGTREAALVAAGVFAGALPLVQVKGRWGWGGC